VPFRHGLETKYFYFHKWLCAALMAG